MKYLFILIALTLTSCNFHNVPFASLLIGPEFKVGDCTVTNRGGNEFDNKDIEKIIKVGKRNYLYEFGNNGLTIEFSIHGYDFIRNKTNCPKGE